MLENLEILIRKKEQVNTLEYMKNIAIEEDNWDAVAAIDLLIQEVLLGDMPSWEQAF